MQQSVQKVRSLEHALDDVRKEASTDALTRIANRRSFDARMRETVGTAMNSGEDLSLILADLDHFKIVNDTWGHPQGDGALCIVAEILQQSVRSQDLVARYGGEEFAGQEGLAACLRAMPGAILLDWNMPVMEGKLSQLGLV